MPRNGSGVYTLPQPPFVTGTVISSAAVNSDFSDLAAAMTASLPRDGQAGMIGQLLAANGSSILPSISFFNETDSGFFRDGTGTIGVVIQGVLIGTLSATGSTIPTQGVSPVGAVIDFAGTTVPPLWYLCYGQLVSRITYSALFTVIGTTYGAGDGVTTFGLPDYRGLVSAGPDNMGGVASGRLTTTYFGTDPTIIGDFGGSQSNTLSISELPAHTHANTLHDPTHSHSYLESSGTFPAPGGSIQLAVPAEGANTGASATGMTITNASVGSGTAFTNVQPSIIINKIIYAGA
jgi:microcystin-dependent protein